MNLWMKNISAILSTIEQILSNEKCNVIILADCLIFWKYCQLLRKYWNSWQILRKKCDDRRWSLLIVKYWANIVEHWENFKYIGNSLDYWANIVKWGMQSQITLANANCQILRGGNWVGTLALERGRVRELAVVSSVGEGDAAWGG